MAPNHTQFEAVSLTIPELFQPMFPSLSFPCVRSVRIHYGTALCQKCHNPLGYDTEPGQKDGLTGRKKNTMKTEVNYYHVQTPEMSMTVLGGPLLPGIEGHVWITSPTGKPLFQVKREHVTKTSRDARGAVRSTLRASPVTEQATGAFSIGRSSPSTRGRSWH